MSEYIKIKRRLYDELVDIKTKYVALCGALELCKRIYEDNKPKEAADDQTEHSYPGI